MCNSERHSLRTGITTGTCAAAAAKACALYLRYASCPDYVSVRNPEGHVFNVNVFREGDSFGVIKDSGDDTCDITNGVKVLVNLEIIHGHNEIIFAAGQGVGTVTLPGLKVPLNEPAINPVPRKMIELAIRDVIPTGAFKVTVSVPNGEELAKKTFNPRLGITGGLSILGTTGIVKPMNEAALLESLSLELNIIRSLGFTEIYITFAGTGEKFLRQRFNITSRNIIQSGNYIGHVLDEAVRLNFTHAVIFGHPGKLLKVAAGNFNTHNRVADGRLEALCTQLALLGASRSIIGRVYHSNTPSEAISIVDSEGYNDVWNILAKIVSRKCTERTCNALRIDSYFCDNDGNILGGYADE
ncbi:MAG: cobalamin biosynthesis protein CbiD [Synergistaceae bacterium]|nr:cobalamin biosynthesis protein CbiD [Synergistaceae bacterium]